MDKEAERKNDINDPEKAGEAILKEFGEEFDWGRGYRKTGSSVKSTFLSVRKTKREAPVLDFDDFLTRIRNVIIHTTWVHELGHYNERITRLEKVTGRIESVIEDRPIMYNAEIRDLNSDKYRLNQPILITIERYSDGEYVATYPELETYGAAENESIAVLDLKKGIISLYEALENPHVELGDIPKGWLRILRGLIDKIG